MISLRRLMLVGAGCFGLLALGGCVASGPGYYGAGYAYGDSFYASGPYYYGTRYYGARYRYRPRVYYGGRRFYGGRYYNRRVYGGRAYGGRYYGGRAYGGRRGGFGGPQGLGQMGIHSEQWRSAH